MLGIRLAAPEAIQVTSLPKAVMTNSPVQLTVSVSYSDSTTREASTGLIWTASGAGSITQGGLFTCIGFGDASVSVHLRSLVTVTQTSCLNAPLPQPQGIFIEQSSEFAGPFPSWSNVKTVYGAKGDGTSDDTVPLQAALNDQCRNNRVIWLPSGTYRISRTLSMQQCFGLTMIGEDPSTTIISWDGALDATMLDSNGSTRTRISRITFDGNSIADAAEHFWWSTSLPYYYPTFNLLSDQRIRNARVGIRIGFAGEITVNRIHFQNLGAAGISEEDYNAGNLWVRDSLFTDCGIGITNESKSVNSTSPGGGWFNVSNVVFVNSKTADMLTGATGPMAIRRSVSVNSRAFFVSLGTGAPLSTIFQGNRIINPTEVPIRIGSPSPVSLIDNTFYRMSSETSILTGDAYSVGVDVFSVGNRGNSTKPFSGRIRKVKSVDDTFFSDMNDTPPEIPTAVYTPPRSSAVALEVPVGSDSSVIQSTVTRASQLPRGGMVHLPVGHYLINETITIPEGAPVQLIGDGPFATVLNGAQSLASAILRSESKHLSVAELFMNQQVRMADPTASGMEIVVPDLPSTHVLMDEVCFPQDISLFVDGIDQALVEVFSGQLNSQTTSQPVSRFIGGSLLDGGGYGFGRVNMFQAGTDFFDLSGGAQLLEEDFWHDDNELGSTIALNGGKGSVTLSGASLHTRGSLPTIDIDNFNGSVSLSGITSTSPLKVGPQSGSTALMLAASSIDFTDSPVPNATALAKWGAMLNVNVAGNRPVSTEDTGESAPLWVEKMLGPLRMEHPRPRLSLAEDAARIRLERVSVRWLTSGIHIVPDSVREPVKEVHYSIKSRDGGFLSSDSSSSCISEWQEEGTDTGWSIRSANDGGIYLEKSGMSISLPSSGGDTNAQMVNSSNSAQEEWLVRPVGDGYFRFVSRVTGDVLTSSGAGSCAIVSASDGSATQEWSISAVKQ